MEPVSPLTIVNMRLNVTCDVRLQDYKTEDCSAQLVVRFSIFGSTFDFGLKFKISLQFRNSIQSSIFDSKFEISLQFRNSNRSSILVRRSKVHRNLVIRVDVILVERSKFGPKFGSEVVKSVRGCSKAFRGVRWRSHQVMQSHILGQGSYGLRH